LNIFTFVLIQLLIYITGLNEGLQALLELTKSGSDLILVAPHTPATVGETQIKLDESCETVISRNVFNILRKNWTINSVFFMVYFYYVQVLKYCFFAGI